MINKLSAWIKAMRLRTLPLAVSGVILGVFLAASHGHYDTTVATLTLLTAILLQILSNFANDYGDFKKGTDNENRIGPERALQSGHISPGEMKKALAVTTALTLVSGIALLYFGFPGKLLWALLFFAIGLAAIWAAVKYTVGKGAYGYSGWGDFFVFVFFGLVSVAGAYFLQTKSFDPAILLPAGTIGVLSAGVLNLNNMRDIQNDIASGKWTLAARMGFAVARWYQAWLFLLAVLASVTYNFLYPGSQWKQLYWLAVIPLAMVLIDVFRATKPESLDPLLKKQALGTLLFALLYGLGQVL